MLSDEPQATLIDVRTRAEWGYVGLPDLSGLGKEPLLVEWQSYPSMQVNDEFGRQVAVALEKRGFARGEPLLFLCRSGVRSQAAALVMTELGFQPCFNIAGGFEGGLDAAGHRGTIAGWKAAGLSWRQS